MAIKHQLQQSIYHLLKHNRDGSFETQSARKSILFQAVADLIASGYKLKHMQGLKQKHVHRLNELWQAKQLSNATIKNRNAHLRWLCEKLGKANVVPANDELGVGKRCYSNNQNNKAIDLQEVDLFKITNSYIKISVHLQRYLGLRREESIKFKPHQADKGNYIELQASWCKGGRARHIPVLTPEARYWLEESKKLVKHPEQSLIPEGKMYIQQRYLYDKQTRLAGIKHAHGLRHAYAQERYKALTGWDCPKCGGPTSRQLTIEQKVIDYAARMTISEELGHSREQITVNYLGR
jgi:integrase